MVFSLSISYYSSMSEFDTPHGGMAPEAQPIESERQAEIQRQAEVQKELDKAIAAGDAIASARAKAELLGLGDFDPGAFRLRRRNESESGPEDWKLHRDNPDNPDRRKILETYAAAAGLAYAEYLQPDEKAAASSEYARHVANVVGTFDVWEGNGYAAPVLTVYTPDGNYAVGYPSDAALGAAQAAGYRPLTH